MIYFYRRYLVVPASFVSCLPNFSSEMTTFNKTNLYRRFIEAQLNERRHLPVPNVMNAAQSLKVNLAYCKLVKGKFLVAPSDRSVWIDVHYSCFHLVKLFPVWKETEQHTFYNKCFHLSHNFKICFSEMLSSSLLYEPKTKNIECS